MGDARVIPDEVDFQVACLAVAWAIVNKAFGADVSVRVPADITKDVIETYRSLYKERADSAKGLTDGELGDIATGEKD